ncbi:MAG: c-type cytochrome [Candidatus Thiodiazotropha sp. (ex Lucina aurantia)]|nr:c-type cytochrome [Candidatus Thiodiazotropha sp. (ex Lucina pensylvanica)]MBT3023013.1 c-type cytochrome [Candidatus Thiodiazotropha taylori]MBV2100000.1 c-type cytochrome [Candidatus Thiodiazotropha sp. (ex Codakia orbicularis)]MBV2102657.1 c-type cytochrome [Candidatus Thiodiazotropha sp. (ex Lucina aurantia)]MBV2117228.1 c-type cytochrome [Candidatus Thiodiazotropha sp. (ex Lucina aurantia)]
MSVLLKTLGFSLGLTLLFTLVTYILPQVEGEAPVEKAVDLSALTMDDFIALGEDLFNNKGTCTLCHKPAPLGRAPDIQGADMVSLSNERLADANYQGEAKDAAGYILESMIEPGRYVVPTWGKKGTNDTESPMPAVDKAPIELSSIEMDAIIAYLQAKDGNEVTVSLPSPEEAESVAGAEAIASGSAALPTPAATAEEALGKFACSSCHALDSADTLVGPGLVDIGARLSKEEIRQSIIDPNAVIAEGFPAAMPADLAEKMTVKELELLVTYLAEKK